MSTGWRLVYGAGESHAGAAAAPARGARNMAVDHALFESVRRGAAPVLRFYTWSPACLSFGRNQHTRELYDPARLREAGVDVVRRPTGGLAVLHDRELTYCVLAPAALLGGPRRTYAAINAALVDGLTRLGVPAHLAAAGGHADPRRDASQPCFRAPADGEVMARGRKLVGSAQRCEQDTVLQHGSILLAGSQNRVLDFLSASVPPVATPAEAATLQELIGRVPDGSELVTALTAGFEAVCGIRLAPGCLTRDEQARLPALEADYHDAAWTWRR